MDNSVIALLLVAFLLFVWGNRTHIKGSRKKYHMKDRAIENLEQPGDKQYYQLKDDIKKLDDLVN